MATLALILAICCLIAGLAGLVLPVLPGAPLIWLGMFVYGLMTGFFNLPWWFYLGQAAGVGLILLADHVATALSIRRYGGSVRAMWGGLAGGLLGVILLGPAGIIFGPFAGAIVAELLAKRDIYTAARAGFATIYGLVGGLLLKLVIAGGMIAWFFVRIF